MTLDVFLTPGEVATADLASRTAVVIDVLRATSTITQALDAGAKAIYPVSSIEDAMRLVNTIGREQMLLSGERKCVRIEGFDLGNSPLEFTPERVGGKTIVMSTTNGTHVMPLLSGASRVLVASLLNLSAVVEELARTGANPVLVCAGRERQFALEDAVCAGEIARRLMDARPAEWQMNDGARAALALARAYPTPESMLAASAAGQSLLSVGFGQDLAFCARIDRNDIVPVLHDRLITSLAPTAAS